MEYAYYRDKSKTYAGAGVDTKSEDLAMSRILPLFRKTFMNRIGIPGENIPLEDHYAAVIKITENMAVAFKTDGVGTKTFIAQHMNKYDTVGIDCVAMNVNDILCTGAEPTSLLDYLAVEESNPDLIYEVARGLKKGADIARISIVGGETAILPEMIKGVVPRKGFDLAGCGLGVIDPHKIINGQNLSEGDVLIGISSSGIHSNGLTLARNVLLKHHKLDLNTYHEKLDRTLGEELLEPTHIYVDEIMTMIKSNLELKALAHITSDGLLNLSRIGKDKAYGYRIDHLPEPQAIYKLIEEYGNIQPAEMYKVYNMGIGMCLTLPKAQVDSALQIASKFGKEAFVMGRVVPDSERKLDLRRPLGLVGDPRTGEFHAV